MIPSTTILDQARVQYSEAYSHLLACSVLLKASVDHDSLTPVQAIHVKAEYEEVIELLHKVQNQF